MLFCVNNTTFNNLIDASLEGYYLSIGNNSCVTLSILNVELLHHNIQHDRSVVTEHLNQFVAFAPNPSSRNSGNCLRFFREGVPSCFFLVRDFGDLCRFSDLDHNRPDHYKRSILDQGYQLRRVHRRLHPFIPNLSFTDLYYGKPDEARYITMLTECDFSFFINYTLEEGNANNWQQEGF